MEYIQANVSEVMDLMTKLCKNVSLKNQKLFPLILAITEILNLQELQLMHMSAIGMLLATTVTSESIVKYKYKFSGFFDPKNIFFYDKNSRVPR